MTEAGRALRRAARFDGTFMRRSGGRLLLLFGGTLLPLWGFVELADEVSGGEGFAFDLALLHVASGMASPGLDRIFVLVSALGYAWFVVPFDIVLVLALAWRRRLREGLFALLALAGAGLLNVVAKLAFARPRPQLWPSIAPEDTFSFPSGHAMGSMTLAWVCVLLAWRTRWRWPVLALALPFVLLVGGSRVYLGVHYPSDILAGWAAASVWAVAMYLVVFRRGTRPWTSG